MKTARQLSTALLIVICAISFYLGIRLLLDPTGSSLNLPFYVLNGTMFADFTVPGWILIAIGATSLAAVIIIFRRFYWYSVFIIAEGIILFGCAVAQMIVFGDENFLQYFFLMMGLGIIALGALQFQLRKSEKQ